MVGKRVDQMKALVSEIYHPDFLTNILTFGTHCKLDQDKLVSAGHSMGGATALKLA